MCNSIQITLDNYGNKCFAVSQTHPSVGCFEVEENDYIRGQVSITDSEGISVISCSLECIAYPYGFFRSFSEAQAVTLNLQDYSDFVEAIAIYKATPFWTEPVFLHESINQSHHSLLHVLCKEANGSYTYLLPLAGANGIATMAYSPDRGLYVSFDCCESNRTKVCAPLVIVSRGSDPFSAIENAYKAASTNGYIVTPLRSEKQFPKELEGLGWCTWNAFYHDVSEAGILAKLDEFREKNIELRWLLIDDGWSETESERLISFFENQQKFPHGLKGLIHRIKNEYKVPYVGVWHALTGYWFGIKGNGNIPEALHTRCQTGIAMPQTFDEAYAFFDQWHSYLKEQGVDFVKVDAQGNAFEFLHHTPGCCQKVQEILKALCLSVQKHFDGSLINCMGLGSLEMFSRPSSAVVRNSDDFFPDKEDGFRNHLLQNAYNSIFNSPLYFCDFDMWWTQHRSAKQSSILRAVSGGPIYISDRVGETDPTYINALLDANGKMIRCSEAARPTADCLFGGVQNGIFKLFNRIGDQWMIAIFNLSDTPIEVTVSASDIKFDSTFQTTLHLSAQDAEFVLFE